MKVALYIGNHQADSLSVRLGHWVTRAVQKGPFADVTHVEAIHDEYPDGSVNIVSSSLRDGGVRAKRVMLTPDYWTIVDVPLWDVAKSKALFAETAGQGYDLRGAVATVFIGSAEHGRWFCNEWVAAPYLQAPATFGPNQFAAVSLSLGRDATIDFFKSRDGASA